MCVHVKALNEDCLLAIFDRVPLAQLLHLDQVCPLWAVLLPLACARRRTLVLILDWTLDRMDRLNQAIPLSDNFEISKDGGPSYFSLARSEQKASLSLTNLLADNGDATVDPDGTEMARFRDARLNGQLVTYLTGLFPNVNTFVVVHTKCYEEELRTLVGLIGSSSWSLVTLKLWLLLADIDGQYVERPNMHPVGALLLSINSQQSTLRQLTLEARGALVNPGRHEFTFPVESFAFIAHLKVAKLFLQYYDSHNSIWNIVHRYDSAQLAQIVIGTAYTLQAALNPQFEFVATKVRQLIWYDWFATEELLGQVCLRFSSLTMLKLYWGPDITFTELVVHLALLPQLAHLVVYIMFDGHHHPPNPFALLNQVEDDGEQEPRPISLPRVKILELIIRKRDHLDLESFSSLVFPSVEMVILKNLRCLPEADCAICRPNITGLHDTQVAKRCFQLMASSLRNKFANPMVRLYADGVIVNPDSGYESFKTVVILAAISIGLPFLLCKMLPI